MVNGHSLNIYDVIIIGAGPAGCAAALQLLKAGVKVLVLTKPILDNDSMITPSQSIHPGTASLLEQLGLSQAIRKAERSQFKGIVVDGNFQPLSPDNDDWYGYHIDRPKFDKALFDYLKSTNLTIIEDQVNQVIDNPTSNTNNVRTKSGLRFLSKFIIDATGYRRLLGKALKLKEKFLSPPMITWTGVSESSKTDQRTNTAFTSQKNGWLWVAPDEDFRFTWTKLIFDKKEEFINPFQELKLKGNITAHNTRWRVFRPICLNNVLLCGDAAGIIDPASGQGIFSALWSGLMAADCINSCMMQPELKEYYLTQYDQTFMEQYENKTEVLGKFYNSKYQVY